MFVDEHTQQTAAPYILGDHLFTENMSVMMQENDVRPKHERIDCMCLVQQDSPSAEGDYTGLWVQCDECQAWLHVHCVGLKKPPKRKKAPLLTDRNAFCLGFVCWHKLCLALHRERGSSAVTATKMPLICRRIYLPQVHQSACKCYCDSRLRCHSDCEPCLHTAAVADRNCQAHTSR